ncbi:IS3 family transposase [Spirosoma luteolum]
MRPTDRRQLAQWLVNAKGLSQRRACRIAGLARRSYDYQARRRPDQPVEQAIKDITRQHPGWGFWKFHHRLRRLGQVFNQKRVWRVYRQMGLNLPRRRGKRLPARLRQPLTVSTAANQVWSLDFTWPPRGAMRCGMVADFER